MPRSRSTSLTFVLFLLVSALAAPFSARAQAGTQPYVGFRKQATATDFAGGQRTGIDVEDRGGVAHVRLASTGLTTGSNKKLYGVKTYSYGSFESPAYPTPYVFDTLIPSWNAETPTGTWIQMELRAFRASDAHWTKYYNLGIWASGTETIERQSVGGQGDADGFVATDTLLLYGAPAYSKYQYRLTLFTTNEHVSPSFRLVSVMSSDSTKEEKGLDIASDKQAWGKELNVPMRSQMIYKGGGEVWCSPTSTSMVLAYWGTPTAVPDAAAATYDYVYEGNGNWPFNTAWAATHGLEAYVTRLGSMAQIEEWISAGVPVVISYAFGENELPGTPIASSAGHIMVVRGFDAQGNVIVNDPAAASDAAVRIVYDRATLERLWLTHSAGTVYLMYPQGHPIPTDKANGTW